MKDKSYFKSKVTFLLYPFFTFLWLLFLSLESFFLVWLACAFKSVQAFEGLHALEEGANVGHVI